MGGGGEKKKTNQMIDAGLKQSNTEHNAYMGAVNTGLSGAQGRAGDMYNSMYGGYNKFIEGGGNFDPSKYGSTSSDGGQAAAAADPRFKTVEDKYNEFMKTGGVDRTKFDQYQANLGDLAKTGGWTPENVASMGENITGFKNIAKTGGVDAEGMNRMRGGGMFDEFARTGGYSSGDIANIRSRATSGIPAMYDAARANAARGAAVQGGYGPGQAALMARMGREQARGVSGAALDAELGIKDKVNAGRQWGGENMASSEGALQGLMSGNRLNALTGASTTEANMANSIAGNRTTAANAAAGNETGMLGLQQSGMQWGTQGVKGLADDAASRSAAASSAAAADAKWRASFDREGQQYGLEGMRALYGDAPGEVGMYLSASDAGQRTGQAGYNSAIGNRIENNPKSNWLGALTGIAGGVGGLMTGAGALGFGRRK